ncbi:hypothetical protein [[Mycoplasma] mobile]|uniref:Expressed protein n=1 Tax=Mycoplasma mobile (strain ATCC 43663 / 163K / NCTC 11711) TaxID=267748 RepID=Q6KIH4_MYCM1|nr:hypothetical protein [[Mycoplasma] mobile]AAT27602.1 expressed protein [Mycoplasma mobile 163K]
MNLNNIKVINSNDDEGENFNYPKLISTKKDLFFAKKLKNLALLDSFCLILLLFFVLTELIILILFLLLNRNDIISIFSIVILGLIILLFFSRIIFIKKYLNLKKIVYEFIDKFDDKSLFKYLIYDDNFWFWVKTILNPVWSILFLKFIFKYTNKIINLFKKPLSEKEIKQIVEKYDAEKFKYYKNKEDLFNKINN